MKRPSSGDLEAAKRLLTHECSDDAHPAKAAARAYQKLHARLAPLIGSAGYRALFFRSLKAAKRTGFTFLEGDAADPAADLGQQLGDSLHGREPGEAAEAAAVVFASFFGLLTTFIGDRLTRQVLRGAWPEMTGSLPAETEK